MKKLTLAVAIVFLASTFAWIRPADAGRVKRRQIHQQKRIHQGVKSGELTRRETVRLEREQARIQRSKRRAWSDGELTRRERARLELQQDHATYHIYRAKHNNRQR